GCDPESVPAWPVPQRPARPISGNHTGPTDEVCLVDQRVPSPVSSHHLGHNRDLYSRVPAGPRGQRGDWIWRDANRRGQPGWLWALLTLPLSWVARLAYVVYGPSCRHVLLLLWARRQRSGERMRQMQPRHPEIPRHQDHRDLGGSSLPTQPRLGFPSQL